MRWLIISLALALSACCWTAKRSCFPACPPPAIVKVEQVCKLPPTLKLPAVKRAECPVDIADWSCYPPAEAANLAKRLADMRDWIVTTRARCAPPASRPAPD